jgi:hypothetical protein
VVGAQQTFEAGRLGVPGQLELGFVGRAAVRLDEEGDAHQRPKERSARIPDSS